MGRDPCLEHSNGRAAALPSLFLTTVASDLACPQTLNLMYPKPNQRDKQFTLFFIFLQKAFISSIVLQKPKSLSLSLKTLSQHKREKIFYKYIRNRTKQ